MSRIEIPIAKGRKFNSQSIDTKESSNFDLPKRDAGRIASLARKVIQRKKHKVTPKVPFKSPKERLERELATVSSPSGTVYTPTSRKESPNLSDLI